MLLCGSIGTNNLEPWPKWEPTSGCARWGYMVPTPQLLLEVWGESGGQLGWVLYWDSLQRKVVLPEGWAEWLDTGSQQKSGGCWAVGVGIACFKEERQVPLPRSPHLPFPFLFPPHNDADCSTSVIIIFENSEQITGKELVWLE